MDYKATLLLPKTDFPMRAELPKREPALLAKWREEKIYGRILAARADAAKSRETTFLLHDGPPFANGDAHMGHALNMVLKDLVLKVQNMKGHYAPFVPGWDCHGLPIEHKVMKDLGAAESDPIRIRAECEKTARHFVEVQREQFQRLGVFGDWENPYLTLDPAYEAETLRVFASLVVIRIADREARDYFAPRHPVIDHLPETPEKATAYLCEDFSCRLPVSEPAELRRMLEELSSAQKG